MKHRERSSSGRKTNIWESAFFVVLLVLAGYVLFRSPFFQVKKVEVTGTHFLNAQEIKNMAGINPGENIFKVNLSQAQKNIQLLPMVKTVALKRILPSTVLISVTERTPLALLDEGGMFAEVDSDGYYLQKGSAQAAGLPIITGITADIPAPGQRVPSSALLPVLKFIHGLPGTLLPQLSEVHLEKNNQLVLYTLNGIPVLMGNFGQASSKGLLLSAILKRFAGSYDKIQYIDLTSTGAPVIKYQP